MGVIFVGGVHGVGKGTLCQQFSERIGVPSFTASSVIRTERQSAIAVDTKAVADPVGNQDLLLRGVRRLLTTKVNILLDGHFTVIDSQNCIVLIDVEVFSQLELQGIVVLEDAPPRICERLRQRDGQEWSVANVSSHQEAEVKHALAIATQLGVTVHLVQADDIQAFTQIVTGMLRRL